MTAEPQLELKEIKKLIGDRFDKQDERLAIASIGKMRKSTTLELNLLN